MSYSAVDNEWYMYKPSRTAEQFPSWSLKMQLFLAPKKLQNIKPALSEKTKKS